MLRSTLASIFALLVAVLTTACSSVTVNCDYDPAADFGSYQDFAWAERGQQQRARRPGNPLAEKRIRREVSAGLVAKGYAEVAPRQADFLVTFYTSSKQKVDVTHIRGYGFRRPFARGYTQVRHYREGTLVLDVVDRRDKELVWRGIAVGAITKPDPSGEKVRAVVTQLLANFPPS